MSREGVRKQANTSLKDAGTALFAAQVRRSAGHGQEARHRGQRLHQVAVQGGVGRSETHCGTEQGKPRQGVISGNPGLREMDESHVSDGSSEEQDRLGNRICLRSSSETLPLCQ